MAIRDDIAQFIGYFRTRNQEVAKIVFPLFRKVLYLVEIDTLSRAAFPMVSGNRKRMLQFIDKCSNWNGKDRISVVQLKFALEGNGIQSGQLYASINGRIDSWGNVQPIIGPKNDLTLEEAQDLATPNERKYVNNARYAELLYTYRNHLLHEFREPGYGVDFGDDLTTQYYHGMDHLTGQSSWELVFPVQFLQNLCEGCISGLEAYLIANNLNPYDSYNFGTMWRRSR